MSNLRRVTYGRDTYPDPDVKEDDLLTAITEAATLYGWRWHHVRRSDRALQMGHAGFPDLCLARKGRVMFFELKRQGKNPTRDQWKWFDELNGQTQQAFVIYPSDLDRVLEMLK